ncbi:hypothetical protein [Spiroplasma phoeniceum]|uniref:Uncharacterized protein n=1 Tax=Spiroplasma phoeniceum P40 TaxID=1276259 RepID=A0A345DQS5_9MOLU|nr:hypothetical protein [Spiroplasma phoeniceum]AXF96566.1 hypothetical protein SDAV_001603 [Spiroplasma phoeniceum P40]
MYCRKVKDILERRQEIYNLKQIITEKNKEIALLKIRIINDNESNCEVFEKGHKLQKENEKLKNDFKHYLLDLDIENKK